ncbi:hypothetical protein ACVIGB_005239 [Bradyrhizobium sp. USDA 4341]
MRNWSFVTLRTIVSILFPFVSIALLLLTNASAARAESLLESVLIVALGGEEFETKDTHIVTTQNDVFLRSEILFRSYKTSTTVNRIGACVFDIDSRGAAVDGTFRVDFSQARFDMVRTAEIRNIFGNTITVLSLPGATLCVKSGQNYANPGVTAGNCADNYDIGPASGPDDFHYFESRLQRIRRECNALSFDRDHYDNSVALR